MGQTPQTSPSSPTKRRSRDVARLRREFEHFKRNQPRPWLSRTLPVAMISVAIALSAWKYSRSLVASTRAEVRGDVLASYMAGSVVERERVLDYVESVLKDDARLRAWAKVERKRLAKPERPLKPASVAAPVAAPAPVVAVPAPVVAAPAPVVAVPVPVVAPPSDSPVAAVHPVAAPQPSALETALHRAKVAASKSRPTGAKRSSPPKPQPEAETLASPVPQPSLAPIRIPTSKLASNGAPALLASPRSSDPPLLLGAPKRKAGDEAPALLK